MTKMVHLFGGAATTAERSKELLGGKGSNLAEMASIGLPVPPGLIITTDVCTAYYANGEQFPAGLIEQVTAGITHIEGITGKKFGDAADPLLVSVRSGAPFSMPGMMDTVLNLGLNDDSVQGLIAQTQNPRFAWDSYRRFIQMFSNVVMGVDADLFENALTQARLWRTVMDHCRERGVGMLVISHDAALLSRVCSRTISL